MRYVYNILLYLILPFIPLRLLWRSRNNNAYRERWSERFGYFKSPLDSRKLIWVHAVSLGETIAAIPLIKALQQQYPDKLILVTNMTPTGSAQTQKTFGENVLHVYAPYDYPGAVKRFLTRIKPELAIIMETELWPNLLHYTHRANIPILLANARLSIRSTNGYQKINFLVEPMLRCITHIAAQSEADAQRFISLGMPKNKVSVAGNIKFDLRLPEILIEQGKELRTQLGNRPVWIAASTHAGEEEMVLKVHAQILKKLPESLLILVPRHPERFIEVAQLCQSQGFNYVTRSSRKAIMSDHNLFFGDTIGEMFLFYSMADIAFVGGSLVATGGHNLLEPAAVGVPTITGPNLFNFTVIAELMNAAGVNRIVNNEQQFADVLLWLMQNPAAAKAAGAAGKNVVIQNQGALQNHLRILTNF